MGWQDDLREALAKETIVHGGSLEVGGLDLDMSYGGCRLVHVLVPGSLARKMEGAVGRVNAGELAGIERGYAILIAVRPPIGLGGDDPGGVAFAVRVTTPWNAYVVAQHPGSGPFAMGPYPYFDFDSVAEETWHDRPPLLG